MTPPSNPSCVTDADKPAPTWWVYIVQTHSGKLYTGITTDIDRRFDEHRSSRQRGAKFFRVDAAATVVYREKVENRSAASRREAAIKKLTRQQKLALVALGDC